MKIDANDPRWTAYALGELQDGPERAELEAILEKSPEMRRLVDEIRGAGDILRRELATEPTAGLAQDQRDRIERKALGKNRFGFKPAWLMAGAAAAVLLTAAILIKQLNNGHSAPQQNQISSVIQEKTAPPQTDARQIKDAILAGQPESSDNTRQSRGPVDETAATAIPPHPASEPEQSAQKPAAQTASAGPESTSNASPQIAGIVTDPSGAVIPGVKITVKDESTGLEKTVLTNNAGYYALEKLSPGKHALTAELSGFQTRKYTDIALNAGNSTKLNVDMNVASRQDVVQVSVQTKVIPLDRSMIHAPAIEKERLTQPHLLNFSAANVNLQRDGITVNDVRYSKREASPSRLTPEQAGKFKMVTEPVDANALLSIQQQRREFNTEAYDHVRDNPFMDVVENPLSTFSIDVDTASYSNMRRFLDGGQLPPKDSIRIEELVNYFDYDYTAPKDGKPFAVNFEVTEAPWKPEHRLLRIGLKGREVEAAKRPAGNMVFLLDVSGSMQAENKLPLVKQAMRLLVNQLTESDRITIVVYAGDTDVLLPSTGGDHKEKILQAIDRLNAGGSTNGAGGIQLAYKSAQEHFIKGGINRVLLATDGDFNVGITNRGDLTRLIEEKAKTGIFLSALGFGMGNYKDSTLELLAKCGHGNYAYIDTLNEAKKIFVEQINSTLIPIAKDVKIQVEFNPRKVSAYRLIGYEDRLMAKEDFNDDTKDAGVIGAGHVVTALYELVPAGVPMPKPSVDPLKYQKQAQVSSSAGSDELVTVKIRSKEPEKDASVLSEFAVKDSKEKFSQASVDFKFAAGVAAFGMALRNSPHKGSADLERALQWSKEGKGIDKHGYRQEFIRLVHKAISMAF